MIHSWANAKTSGAALIPSVAAANTVMELALRTIKAGADTGSAGDLFQEVAEAYEALGRELVPALRDAGLRMHLQGIVPLSAMHGGGVRQLKLELRRMLARSEDIPANTGAAPPKRSFVDRLYAEEGGARG